MPRHRRQSRPHGRRRRHGPHRHRRLDPVRRHRHRRDPARHMGSAQRRHLRGPGRRGRRFRALRRRLRPLVGWRRRLHRLCRPCRRLQTLRPLIGRNRPTLLPVSHRTARLRHGRRNPRHTSPPAISPRRRTSTAVPSRRRRTTRRRVHGWIGPGWTALGPAIEASAGRDTVSTRTPRASPPRSRRWLRVRVPAFASHGPGARPRR